MRHWLFSRAFISYMVVAGAVVSPLLIVSLVPGASFHDNQRIIETFIAAVGAAYAAVRCCQPVSNGTISQSRIYHVLAIFFLLGLGSSIAAYSSRFAFFEWANFLLLFSISSLISAEIVSRDDRFLDKILYLCVLGCAFYIFIEVVIYAAILNVGGQPLDSEFFFGFSNYRFFNHVQTVTLPLLGLFVVRTDGKKKRIFGWAVISAWWALLFLSAGRGTFIGLLAGICVAWFYLRQQVLPWGWTMLWSALIGLAAYFLFYVLVPLALGLQPFGFLFSVFGRTIENPGSSRWPLWVRAWEIMVAHPWLGAGPLHFAHFGRDVQLGAHPHNWILQIACEWGIPALLCLLTAIAFGFKRLLTIRQYLDPMDIKNHLTLAAWLTIGVAILVDGLVSGLIVMPTSQLWIALYIGCAWGWVASITRMQPDARLLRLPMTIRICVAIVMLAAIYLLANGLSPEIRNLPLYEEQSLQKELYSDPILRPRIWLGGYF